MTDKKKHCQCAENEKADSTNETLGSKPGQAQEPSEGDKVAEPTPCEGDKTAELTAEVDLWKDKYLRLSAEYDNYRKRTTREKLDLIASGGEDVIKAMLVVVDDMERALDALEKAENVDSVKEGVLLIYKKLMQTLAARGVAEIEALGKELDTDLHEAVARMAGDPDQKGKIIDVIQKGYKLKDKVVRYAKVVVGE